MKIFIDFDDTLFHTKKFKADLITVFLKHGISKNDFDSTYKQSLFSNDSNGQTCYDPAQQIKILTGKNCNLKNELTADFEFFMQDLAEYVFPDSYDFLRAFDRKDLFLISFGDRYAQKEKVVGSGLGPFFQRVIITTENKLRVINRLRDKSKAISWKDIYFIDDRSDQLEKLSKQDEQIHTLHIRRKEGRYSKLFRDGGDLQIKNLKEAKEIILSGKML